MDGFQRPIADVRDWGTPTAANIQTALNDMGAAGGGDVQIRGNIVCDQPVEITAPNVRLVAAGEVSWTQARGWSCGARLTAAHNGAVLKIRSPYGATNPRIDGGGVRGVMQAACTSEAHRARGHHGSRLARRRASDCQAVRRGSNSDPENTKASNMVARVIPPRFCGAFLWGKH